jgi:hypothetical protein
VLVVDEIPFLGSAAMSAGALTRHQLRTRFTAVFPNVYLPSDVTPSLRQRTVAAWLWSGREAVIAGAAAAAVHGSRWIDDDEPIELIHPSPRSPRGIVTYRDMLQSSEVQRCSSSPLANALVTTPERTAFDIGRRCANGIGATVARLDALANVTRLRPADVRAISPRPIPDQGGWPG